MPLLWILLAATWESPRVPAGAAPPQGLSSMTAESCGTCHSDFYAEWQMSVHAAAWTDVQFQGELAKDPEVAWLCINCHTPAGDQQQQITRSTGALRSPDRSDNPRFDADWQQEGITCVSCHYRDGKILGPTGVANGAPHPVEKDERLLSSALCLECHQAVAQLEDTLVCNFNTGTEWEESGSDKSCQDCHMPPDHRPVVSWGQPRDVRVHTFLGSGIPKQPLDAKAQAVYDAVPVGYELRVELPTTARPGGPISGQLVLHNVGADHYIPSGDPERYLLATLEARSGGQRLLASTYRVGQRWRWWPKAERLADNRLKPGEERAIPIALIMPEGPVEIAIEVAHYRISPENAAYHELGDYPIRRITHSVTHVIEPQG